MQPPVVAGILLAPQLLLGAGPVVLVMLGMLFVVSTVAYALSVLAPGAPCGAVFRPAARIVGLVRQGIIARTEISIPFAEVARIGLIKSVDHDGYERQLLELRTRGGDIWVVPCEIDDADIARMRGLVGLKNKATA